MRVDYETSKTLLATNYARKQVAWLDCLDCELIPACPGRCDLMIKKLDEFEAKIRKHMEKPRKLNPFKTAMLANINAIDHCLEVNKQRRKNNVR